MIRAELNQWIEKMNKESVPHQRTETTRRCLNRLPLVPPHNHSSHTYKKKRKKQKRNNNHYRHQMINFKLKEWYPNPVLKIHRRPDVPNTQENLLLFVKEMRQGFFSLKGKFENPLIIFFLLFSAYFFVKKCGKKVLICSSLHQWDV